MNQTPKTNNEETVLADETKVNTEENNIEEKETKVEAKKSSIKKVIVTIAILATLGGTGFFVYTTQVKSNEELTRVEPIKKNYTSFIDSWNKQVQNNTSEKEFLLSREANDEVIKQLEEWMKNFYIPNVTNFPKYNNFLEENKFGKPSYFDVSMSKNKIRELLKKATKEKVMSQIVKKVLMMNDMELWEKLEK